MSALMTTPRHIAPGAAAPVSLAPGVSPSQSKVVVKPPENAPPVIGANDIIFVNGQAFNGRGYPVCGVANQRGRLCGRIGTCPFHSKNNSAAKRPRSGLASSNDPAAASDIASGKGINAISSEQNNGASSNGSRPGGSGRNMHPAIRQMSIPPRRSRFKRSWTTDEHRRFLQAMRLHGKGKWKEIAVEVKTRNANQCQSHAQKYFLRQAKSDSERKKKSIHDVTEEDVSNETATNSLIWPPNVLQAVSQGLPCSVASTHLPVMSQPGVGATPVVSRHATSGVPLAPRVSPEQSGSAPMATAASRLTALQRRSAGAAHNLNLLLPGNSDQSAQWGTAGPMSSGGAATTPVSGMMSVHTSSGSGNSLVPSTSGRAPTVPMMFPMTSLGLQYASMASFINPSLGNASNSAIVVPPVASKTRVTVHVNGKLKGGMALMLTESLHEFFEQAEAKLLFAGKFARVFTRSGGEIMNIDEMCQDDMLWLSTGEDFLTPR